MTDFFGRLIRLLAVACRAAALIALLSTSLDVGVAEAATYTSTSGSELTSIETDVKAVATDWFGFMKNVFRVIAFIVAAGMLGYMYFSQRWELGKWAILAAAAVGFFQADRLAKFATPSAASSTIAEACAAGTIDPRWCIPVQVEPAANAPAE